MVFRKLPMNFCMQRVKKRTTRWIVNELPKTFNDQVYPQLPFKIRRERYRIKNPMDNNPGGQLYGLTFAVTDLFRDERIVLGYNKATEIRNHVERLIVEAMRNGDRHRPTMALANFWLREKLLIHKLFKEFVPRYSEYSTAFTALHILGKDYSKAALTIEERKECRKIWWKSEDVVLEMKGNNLPPIIRPKIVTAPLLTNVLLDGARAAYNQKPVKD